MDDLSKAITAANTVVATGKLEDRHQLYPGIVDSPPQWPRQPEGLPIKTGSGATTGMLTLGQIADVRLKTARLGRGSLPKDEIGDVNVRQTPDADSVTLVKTIRAKLAGLGAAARPDVRVDTFYDQSELVSAAAGSVRDAILLGALLAGVVLFFSCATSA